MIIDENIDSLTWTWGTCS